MEIRKAARQKAKLRVGVSGPSGSGKSYSAILIANGIASDKSKVAIIDTENGSADLYADLGDFSVIRLEAPYSPERYVEAIKAIENAGFEVVIIDSVTHEWDGKGGCLEINDLIAQTKFRGNTWSAWSVTTPRHQKFIEAITTSPLHVITTARSKTDTIQTEDKKIKKVGLKEIQREGFEYELTLNFTIDRDGHYATSSKDRTKLFSETNPFVITEETGKILKNWAENGVDPIAPKPAAPAPAAAPKAPAAKKPAETVTVKKNKVMTLVKMLGYDMSTVEDKKAFITETVENISGLMLNDENLDEIISRLEIIVRENKEAGI